jgi:hypothetical protein
MVVDVDYQLQGKINSLTLPIISRFSYEHNSLRSVDEHILPISKDEHILPKSDDDILE